MAVPVLVMKWDDHANKLATECKSLLEKDFLVDCTVAAEGGSLNAHRLILSASSPYFQMLFSEEGEKNPIVILTDTSFATLKTVIDFVYNGKAEIPVNQLEAFLDLAESLQIKGLSTTFRKNRTDVGGPADDNAHQCASVNEDDPIERTQPSYKDNLSTSSQQHASYLPRGLRDNEHTMSSVPLERPSGSCEGQSGAMVIPLQGAQSSPLSNSAEAFIDPERSVRNEPCHSEIEFVEIESEVLDDCEQGEPMSGELESGMDEVCIDKERNVECDPLCSEIELVEKKSEVLDDPEVVELLSDSEMSDAPASASDNIFDQHLCAESPSPEQDEQQAMQQRRRRPRGATRAEAGFSPKELQDHERLTRTAALQCSQCDASFTSSQDLEDHRSQHSGDPTTQTPKHTAERSHTCDVCKKAFRHSRSLASHKRLHTGKNLHPCDVCGKAFTIPACLAKHKRVHTGEKPYPCDVCGKVFGLSGDLNRHKRIHTGEKPYQCDVCRKSFTQAWLVARHRLIHTRANPYPRDVAGKARDEKPHQCDVCGKGFRESWSLASHKRIHTGEKPHQCEVCGKAFSRPWLLTNHMRVHTGEKTYRCDVCGKAFTRSSVLARHKRFHTGETPYPCDVCGKAFRLPWTLASHKLIHTGEKPFRCVCGKAFRHSGDLNRHKRAHSAPPGRDSSCRDPRPPQADAHARATRGLFASSGRPSSSLTGAAGTNNKEQFPQVVASSHY